MPFLNCDSIAGNLKFYERDYTIYTKCLVRKREIKISGHPEEKVRQCFLYFLINELLDLLNTQKIKICVEENNFDISISQIFENDDFQPNVSPLIIIEIKKQNVDINSYKQQLIGYMKQYKCNVGLISNAEDAVLLEKNNIGNISECILVENKILIAKIKIIQAQLIANDCNIQHFQNARNGDIQSFIFLIKKYGRYTTHKIKFKIFEEEIAGYCFKVDEKRNKISYNRCGGGYTKKQNIFEYNEYNKLLSIKY
jgi:hypothetical protein